MAVGFTHPNFGTEVRLKQEGREIHVIFVASSTEQATDLFENVLKQLKNGALNITLMGKATSVKEVKPH